MCFAPSWASCEDEQFKPEMRFVESTRQSTWVCFRRCSTAMPHDFFELNLPVSESVNNKTRTRGIGIGIVVGKKTSLTRRTYFGIVLQSIEIETPRFFGRFASRHTLLVSNHVRTILLSSSIAADLLARKLIHYTTGPSLTISPLLLCRPPGLRSIAHQVGTSLGEQDDHSLHPVLHQGSRRSSETARRPWRCAPRSCRCLPSRTR